VLNQNWPTLVPQVQQQTIDDKVDEGDIDLHIDNKLAHLIDNYPTVDEQILHEALFIHE
jgi:hypothetical protein